MPCCLTEKKAHLKICDLLQFMKCIECNAKVPVSVAAFTRCLYCGKKELCMIHRLPEKHVCEYKSSERFKKEMNDFSELLIKNKSNSALMF